MRLQCIDDAGGQPPGENTLVHRAGSLHVLIAMARIRRGGRRPRTRVTTGGGAAARSVRYSAAPKCNAGTRRRSRPSSCSTPARPPPRPSTTGRARAARPSSPPHRMRGRAPSSSPSTATEAASARWCAPGKAAAAAAGVILLAPRCPRALGCAAGSWWQWYDASGHDPAWLGAQIDAVAARFPVDGAAGLRHRLQRRRHLPRVVCPHARRALRRGGARGRGRRVPASVPGVQGAGPLRARRRRPDDPALCSAAPRLVRGVRRPRDLLGDAPRRHPREHPPGAGGRAFAAESSRGCWRARRRAWRRRLPTRARCRRSRSWSRRTPVPPSRRRLPRQA